MNAFWLSCLRLFYAAERVLRRAADRCRDAIAVGVLLPLGSKQPTLSPLAFCDMAQWSKEGCLLPGGGNSRAAADECSLTSTRLRSNMKLNLQDLEKITDLTLGHYNARAEDFWEGTRDHDVKQNITAVLSENYIRIYW